jgi:hypothetical protein
LRKASEGKQFFFEKKNQKTFSLFRVAPLLLVWVGIWGQRIKVFWFFFSKKNLSCLDGLQRSRRWRQAVRGARG